MGYKLKRILIYPDGVTEKQVYPKRLPSAYQEVEWIAGTGQYNNNYYNYINTGIVGTSNIGGCAVMSYNNNTQNNQFWFSNLVSTNRWGMMSYPAGCWCPQWYTYIQTNVSYNANQFYEIKLNWNNDKKCQIDGTNIQNLTTTFTGTTNIMIGADNQGTQFEWKCKSFKLTDGTTLVRDFVPCYRIADSVIGMYDLVNNQFYTNSGTGTFTKGPDV